MVPRITGHGQRTRRLPAVLAVLLLLLGAAACHEDEARTPLHFAPDSLGKAVLGVPYSATVSVYQHRSPVGEIGVTSGSLPPGLELEHLAGASSATISGTPTQAGTFRFRLGAWCSADRLPRQRGERSYAIVVDW